MMVALLILLPMLVPLMVRGAFALGDLVLWGIGQ